MGSHVVCHPNDENCDYVFASDVQLGQRREEDASCSGSDHVGGELKGGQSPAPPDSAGGLRAQAPDGELHEPCLGVVTTASETFWASPTCRSGSRYRLVLRAVPSCSTTFPSVIWRRLSATLPGQAHPLEGFVVGLPSIRHGPKSRRDPPGGRPMDLQGNQRLRLGNCPSSVCWDRAHRGHSKCLDGPRRRAGRPRGPGHERRWRVLRPSLRRRQ